MKQPKKVMGNALSQYSIIIVLVALALVPVFFITGQYLFKNFESFSSLLKGNQIETKPIITPKTNDTSIATEQQPVINNTNDNETTNDKESINNTGAVNDNISTVQAGEPENAPVVKCNGGNCSIDYGDFVLNGIPENFGSFVEANGTSGGTEKLAAILEQIAVQLEQKGDTAGSKDFRDLANTWHIVARIDNSIESDLSKRVKNSFLNTIYPPTVNISESEIKALQEIYPDWKYSNTDRTSDIIFDIIGNGDSNGSSTGFASYISNRIMEGTYSTNMKAIVGYCHDTAWKLNNSTYYILSNSVKLEDAKNFIHPKPSAGTHSNASIICVTGYNKDNGNHCRK